MMDETMLELRNALARTCAICERELGEHEQRVVLPAYVQERDAFVREGLVERRVACVECAMSLKTRMKERVRRARASEARAALAYLRMLED